MDKPKLYMVCDFRKGNYNQGANNIGIEFMGDCGGRLLDEEGKQLGEHWSSSNGWLRKDLRSKVENPNDYEFIDLIDEECPIRFKKK